MFDLWSNRDLALIQELLFQVNSLSLLGLAYLIHEVHEKHNINKKNYNMNNHAITDGFKSIRKQMYKLYIE